MARPIEAFEASKALSEFGLGQTENPGVITNLEYSYDHAPHPHYDIRTELGNEALPVFEHKAEILEAVRSNPVTIIVAETGAGKSTQIPQYLLDDGYKKVHVTQPRRTAARNVFMRIHEEVAQVRGTYAADDLIGYQTAGEFEGDENAQVMVVTDGLHLVKELNDKGVLEDEVLIIDEAHEWNSNVEVLIGWTKEAIRQNPRLKVVIMSATIDSQNLANFYGEHSPEQEQPPVIEIKNRHHKVTETQKPESTVIDQVINTTLELQNELELPDGPCGILVFEPGKREIQDAIDSIRARLPKNSPHEVKIFPLHAKLSKSEQQAALEEYPGCIKIVVSTDVAQTSLTIPDIKYVVDSGLHRRVELDNEGTPGLKLVPTSQADCKQRAGRVGRVSDGFYTLTRLNESTPFIPLKDRDAYPIPEIMRTDVARNMLRLLELNIDIGEFNMYHRASEGAIAYAKENLQILGALDENHQITEIGHQMNRYPACASSGRMLVESQRYDPATRSYIAAFAAVREAGGLQYYSQHAGKKWESLSDEAVSDLLLQLDLFIAAQNMSAAELQEYDLDIDNFKRSVEQYHKIAKLAGAPIRHLTPPTEKEREDILQCIFTGFTPFIYTHAGNNQYVHAYRSWKTLREISNRSIVSGGQAFIIGDPYRIELGGEDPTTRQSLENVTALSTRLLGSVAMAHTTLAHVEFFDQAGKFMERKRRLLFGVDIDIIEESPAEPSPALRQEIIEHAIANPGSAQKYLRNIKKTLEELQRIAKSDVPQLTQRRLEDLIAQAASEGITRPSEIEDNLRILIADPANKLTLDSFVTEEQQAEIHKNAPATICLPDGSTVHLAYANKIPVAKRYNPESVLSLNDPLVLPDGREIVFARPHRRKKYTLHELQEELRY
jgi:HrpA-like RNA helicase